MRRGRLGHLVAATFAISGIVDEINRAIWNHSLFAKVISAAIAVGLLFYILIPRLRIALSAERPTSILWEFGFGRPRGAEVWIPIAIQAFLEPGERLELGAIASPGRGKFFRFVALTDQRFVLLKSLPPGMLPVGIDVEVPRAQARAIGMTAGPLGSSRVALELGDRRRRLLIFSRRFATQARAIADALSSSGPASATPS
jgi:hypothetical protein